VEEAIQSKTKLADFNLDMRTQLLNKESANDYKDFLDYTKKNDEISETINNRLRDHGDIINELKVVALVKYEKDKIEFAKLEGRGAEANKELKKAEHYLEKLDLLERNSDREAAVLESKAAVLEKEIAKDEVALKVLMEGGLILVSENATEALGESTDKLMEIKLRLQQNQADYDDLIKKLEGCRNKINKADVTMDVLTEESRELEHNSAKLESVHRRCESLFKVYNETDIKALLNIITNTYKNDSKEADELVNKLKSLKEYEENLVEGKYICNGKQYLQVKDYLFRHYGEDVIDGQTWYRSLNAGQKRDVLKRTPFVCYGFIIKNGFEKIKSDTTLQNFNQSSYVVPVMSEGILTDMKLEVNSDMVRFATKDLTFLNDETKVEAELKNTREEIDNFEHKLSKLKDRVALIWEDYEFVLCYSQKLRHPNDNQSLSLEKVLAKLKSLNEEKTLLLEGRQKLEIRCEEKKKAVQISLDTIRELENDISILTKIKELNEKIHEKYTEFKSDKKNAKESMIQFESAKAQLSESRSDVHAKKITADALLEEKTKKDADWEKIYLPYYSESADITNASAYSVLTSDQLESKFLGLRAVIEKETADISDKNMLMNTYKASIEKSRNNIAYRGLDFDVIAKMFENNEIYACTSSELMDVKNKLKRYDLDILKFDKEIEAQSALMNRIEGSIEHGKRQIAEKYGEFEQFSCGNPTVFIEQHKTLCKRLHENIKEMEIKIKSAEAKIKEVLLIEKDLERIVKNAGLIVPENIDIFGNTNDRIPEGKDINVQDYERVQKEFESLIKLEYKKKEDFQKQKSILVEKLNKLNAFELASEVTGSIKVPETVEKARELKENIIDTNTFIMLEKDRISKGIEDMERIKDNFENRCVQTCVNIKTELDRLPSLSTITLEDEVISIIGIQIPYVKEEFYKNRMSSYINETVTGAESFKNADERLKYIRNRLTWKRLFSVIVTDMNAIRINLYKRERIKDQSRYLKYEEAVGSTGQSQGIYIQFLIAIINYISSINATSHENSSLGKVIFIDNPFGAAKDIYIWEPIFKLLKTNHVQLIVPARGATPAITGRFDVNYILGQKLVDGKQQTVVVDYQSQIKAEEIEYTTMDFEQTTLFDMQ